MKCVASYEAGGVPSSLAWHPDGNALALALESGVVKVWEGPVPAEMTGPTADPEEQAHRVAEEGGHGEDGEDEDEGVGNSGLDSHAGEAAPLGRSYGPQYLSRSLQFPQVPGKHQYPFYYIFYYGTFFFQF